MCRFILDARDRARHDHRPDRARHRRGDGPLRPRRRARLRAARSPTARPAEVRADPAVIDAYLGVDHAEPAGAADGLQFFVEVLVGGLLVRRDVLAGRDRLRADLQDLGRLQLRAGRDGAVRGAHLRQPGRARRAVLASRSASRCAVDGGCSASPSSASCCGRWSTSRRSPCSWRRSACPTSSRACAQLLWGAQVHGLDLGIDDMPFEVGGVLVSQFDLFAAGDRRPPWSRRSPSSSSCTRIGLAFRAVADDQLAALAVGLRLPRIWAMVWAAAGIVALVAGLLWGARLGVQFSLSLVVLKALPVLVLGGFDSIAGAIVGGLDDRRHARSWPRSTRRRSSAAASRAGSPTSWRSLFLLVRPTGLFGRSWSRGSEPWPRSACAPRGSRRRTCLPARGLAARRCAAAGGRLRACCRCVGADYLFEAILTAVPGAEPGGARAQPPHRLRRPALARHGGLHGGGRLRRLQLQAAPAGAAAARRASLLAGLVAAAVGLVFGLPSLRIRGFYLAVSTLAAQFFVQWALTKFGWFSNDNASGVISAPPLAIAGLDLDTPVGRYLLIARRSWSSLTVARRRGSSRTPTGPQLDRRARQRDRGRGDRHAGAAHQARSPSRSARFYSASPARSGPSPICGTVEPHGFDLDRSFQILFIIIIGGSPASAAPSSAPRFIVVLPLLLSPSRRRAARRRRRLGHASRSSQKIVVRRADHRLPDRRAARASSPCSTALGEARPPAARRLSRFKHQPRSSTAMSITRKH